MTASEFSKKPIFLIGAARSGTTVLGEILSHHSRLAYWIEPKYVWRFHAPQALSDQRTAAEASPRVKGYIQNRFAELVCRNHKERFLEKTPSNCFRIPFIDALFPDALFLNILRDGRDVVLSAEKKWTSPPDKMAFIRRVKSADIPLSDLPYYIRSALVEIVGRQFLPKRGFLWGPVFPGMREFISSHTVLECCAEQWCQSVLTAKKDLEALPKERVFTVKFEDLVHAPIERIQEVLDFCELDPETEVSRYANEILDASAVNRWQLGDQEKIAVVERLTADALDSLGYARSSAFVNGE